MLKLLKFFILGAFMVGSASAATVTVTNFVNPNYSSILNASGIATSGVVALGTYSTEPLSVSNYLTGFTQLGSLQFGTTYGGPLNGYVAGDINFSLPVGNAAVGQQVYVVVGNGATLATSTQVFVFKPTSNPAGNVFVADNPVGGPDSIRLLGNLGTTVLGSYGVVNGQTSFTMVAVPEPSVALLGAIGGLALLRRRRN